MLTKSYLGFLLAAVQYLLVSTTVLAIGATSATATWVSDGPIPREINYAVVVDPGDSNVLYTATNNHGVFKSTDGGLNWNPVNGTGSNRLPTYDPGNGQTLLHPVVGLAIDPLTTSATAVIYAILSRIDTDITNPSTAITVFKSTDAGANWTAVLSVFNPSAIAVHRTSTDVPATVYVGTDQTLTSSNELQPTIFTSTDGGTNWRPCTICPPSSVSPRTLVIDPRNSSTAFVGTFFDGVRISEDGGATWFDRSGGLPGAAITALAIDPLTPGTLYAGAGAGPPEDPNLAGVYKTTNGGASWTATALVGTVSISALAVDVSNPQVVYAATSNGFGGFYKTTEGGSTPGGTPWTDIGDGLPATAAAIAIDPSGTGTVHVAAEDGVYTLQDDGDTPDSFVFTDQTGVPRNSERISNAITVAGIDAPASISVTGGDYQINNGSFTSVKGSVNVGDQVRVRHISAATFGTATNTMLTIGGVSDTFTSVTEAADTTPNAFTFTDVSGVTLGSVQTSNQITVSGINSSANVSIVGGEYSRNGGTFTSAAGLAAAGDTFVVRHTSSTELATATNTTLTLGGISDTFTSITEPAGGTLRVASSLRFGSVALFSGETQELVISNTSKTESLQITNIVVTSPSPPFTLVVPAGAGIWTIPPRGSFTIIIGFQPISVGEAVGSLFFASSDPNKLSTTVRLIGRGR